jgi:hypothetical protein
MRIFIVHIHSFVVSTLNTQTKEEHTSAVQLLLQLRYDLSLSYTRDKRQELRTALPTTEQGVSQPVPYDDFTNMSHSLLVASVVLSSSAALVNGFGLRSTQGRRITNGIALHAANQNAPVEIRDVKVSRLNFLCI